MHTLCNTRKWVIYAFIYRGKTNELIKGINYEIMINNARLELGYYEQVTLMDEMRRVIVEELKVVKKWHYMRRKVPQSILDMLDTQRGGFVKMLEKEEYRVRF